MNWWIAFMFGCVGFIAIVHHFRLNQTERRLEDLEKKGRARD